MFALSKSECFVEENAENQKKENAENPGITESHSGELTLNVFLCLLL